jgi:hypothetical protein
MDLVVIRILFVLLLTAACFFLRPFALQPGVAASRLSSAPLPLPRSSFLSCASGH